MFWLIVLFPSAAEICTIPSSNAKQGSLRIDGVDSRENMMQGVREPAICSSKMKTLDGLHNTELECSAKGKLSRSNLECTSKFLC